MCSFFGRGGGAEYRQMLVAAIHSCAVKFPEVASSVVHLLMDFLGDAMVGDCLPFAESVPTQ